MLGPIIWTPILHFLTDHVRAHMHLCLNPGWFPNLIDMLQTYKVMPLCGKPTSNFLRRSICLFVEHSFVSAHDNRRFDVSLQPPQRSSLPGLRCWQPQCRPAPARSGLLTQTWNCLALKVMIHCCRGDTHTVILLRPLIVGVKQLQRATQKGKSAAPYLFTRLNNSFKALNLLLVFLLLQLERQRTWTEFSWKAKLDKLLTYLMSLLAWWSSLLQIHLW